ncbi:hypothetical protein [Thermonema sp.]|uniref:hypothetical protein n=1 Tax=Thermonema sp. TaxID=2231181 RepID=UPI00258ADE42|nr:hypothetical protein [Thermonema sp.]
MSKPMHDLLTMLKEYKSHILWLSGGMVGLMLFIMAMIYGEHIFSPPPRVIDRPRAQQLALVKQWIRCRCTTVAMYEQRNDTLQEDYLLGYDAQGRLRAHNRHIFFDYDSLNRFSAFYIYHDDEGYIGRRVTFRYLPATAVVPFTQIEASIYKIANEQISKVGYTVVWPFPIEQAAWYELLPPAEPLTQLPKKQAENIWLMMKEKKSVYWVFDTQNRLMEEIEVDPYLPTTYSLSRRRFQYDTKGLLIEKIQIDSIINQYTNIRKLTGKQLFRYTYDAEGRPLRYEELLWNGVEWVPQMRRKCTYHPPDIHAPLSE